MPQPELNSTQRLALQFYETEISKRLKKSVDFSARDFYEMTREISEEFKHLYSQSLSAIVDFPTQVIQPEKNDLPATVFYLGFTSFLKNILAGVMERQEPADQSSNSIEPFSYSRHNRLDVKETNAAYSLYLD